MARRKVEIGDDCPKGHRIDGPNLLVRGKTFACRTCWNQYLRDRYAEKQSRNPIEHIEALIAAKKRELEALEAKRDAARTARVRELLDSAPMPD